MPTVEEMKNELFYKPEHASKVCDDSVRESADAFAEGYKTFLNEAKTEREATAVILKEAQSRGFVRFDANKKYVAGDKVYFVNRDKAIILAVIGKSVSARVLRLQQLILTHPDLT